MNWVYCLQREFIVLQKIFSLIIEIFKHLEVNSSLEWLINVNRKQELTVTILFQSDPKTVYLTNTEINTSTFKKRADVRNICVFLSSSRISLK